MKRNLRHEDRMILLLNKNELKYEGVYTDR